MRRITFSLDPKEIARARKEILTFRREFIAETKLFMSRLVDAGAEIARNEVISLGAFDGGGLASSFQGSVMYSDGGNKGIIFTDCPYAAYVELGTGIVGADHPHPTMPWDYDVNHHGESGWVYYADGKFHWTKGMPSRPFMYHAALELERRIPEIARGAWK